MPETGSARQEIEKKGIGVAPGIAIGPVYLYTREAFDVEERRVEASEVAAELERFEEAVVKSERELRKIGMVTREKLGDESASIFDAQMLMLRDESVYHEITDRIRNEHFNADYAVFDVLDRYRQRLLASDSDYMRERAHDLHDVQDRIVRHLRRGKILSEVDHNSIVVAENLTAADVILFSRRNILGCAMDFGGATSHVSIMARALNLPAVVGMHGITEVVHSGDLIVLDGHNGRVVVNPTPETLAAARAQHEEYKQRLEDQKTLTPLVSETLDGRRVHLRMNAEFKEECDLLAEVGAEGIGLFRTEMQFLVKGRLTFSEEDQYKLYHEVVDRVAPAPTTFRVLDLGGDKVLPLAHREQNPFLGWRGIRILLDKPDLFLPQLRSILRASAHGPVRILLPMITTISEVHRFKEMLKEAQADLRKQGLHFDPHTPIGIMVEVPSVVLCADCFAAEVDFFSIGSNDLTQYALAVDRGNDLVSPLYAELHPAVLRLIELTVAAAEKHHISVGLCGELAADPQAAPILIGLGIRELSMAPRFLPEVKRMVRNLTFEDARKLAQKALQAQEASQVVGIVQEWMHANHMADVPHSVSTPS